VEEAASKADEGNDQQHLKRVDDMIRKLGGGNVQSKHKRDPKAHKRCAPKQWVDPDHQTGSDAPCKLFRRRAHPQKCKDGQNETAIQPAVMDRITHTSTG
jgi:hypothetical protein